MHPKYEYLIFRQYRKFDMLVMELLPLPVQGETKRDRETNSNQPISSIELDRDNNEQNSKFPPYILRHGITHLLDVGNIDAAKTLLLDVNWLMLRAREGIRLLEDCKRVSKMLINDRVVHMLGNAVLHSLNDLRKDPNRLASQLVGRLMQLAGSSFFLAETSTLLYKMEDVSVCMSESCNFQFPPVVIAALVPDSAAKHHCRRCGHVVCDLCSRQRTRDPIDWTLGRVCDECFECFGSESENNIAAPGKRSPEASIA